MFVVDLATGELLRTIDSGIQNAFAGSLVNGQMDFEQNDPTNTGYYQDEAVYFGFTKSEDSTPTSSTQWNVGGVLRLLTKDSPDPADWALSTAIDGVGPVTSAVAKLQNYTNRCRLAVLGYGKVLLQDRRQHR